MSATDLVPSPRKFCMALLLAAICGLVLPGPTAAGEQTHRLRGLFCNTEGQLDEALGHMSRNVAPRPAAELTNDVVDENDAARVAQEREDALPCFFLVLAEGDD